MNTHMNKIGIPTVLESTVMQIESSLVSVVQLNKVYRSILRWEFLD